MPESASKVAGQTWIGPVRGFGVLCLLAGTLFLVVGGFGAFQRHTEATNWPAAEAQVSECQLQKSYHIRSHVPGTKEQARCTFQYDVGGVTYQESKDAGSSVFYSSKQIILIQPKVTQGKLARWIVQHPKGSKQTIHYNPANPRQISLAGADDDIQENTPEIRLKIAVSIFCVGLTFLLVSLVGRQRMAVAIEGLRPD
jgi:hypothetical protein